jgi:[ribosomal protein S5]-alanine N-acetyltransferase
MAVGTSRLVLIPWSPQQLLGLIEQPDSFEEATGFRPADGLREFFVSGDVSPTWIEALRVAESPDAWRHGFVVVERELQLAIGSAGFKGPPDSDGVVEIAYGIVPSAQGKGYATEAAAALVDYAVKTADVKLIRAHTLPEANASTRVLEKCGFSHVGSVVDPEDGLVWRWERGRNSSSNSPNSGSTGFSAPP